VAQQPKHTKVVDGFTMLKAAERAKTAPRAVTKPVPVPVEPARSPVPAAPLAAEKTTRPSRHDIICYECGFTFFLTGALKSTYCPKCRCILDASEQKIETAWSGTLRTIGTVTISETGSVNDGEITTGNIVLAGKISGGKIKVWGKLEICPGGLFLPECISAESFVIRKGASWKSEGVLIVKNLEIAGEFEGAVKASGVVAIKSGGVLKGSLAGSHLVMEDGGGLDAMVDIRPEEPAAEPRPAGDGGRSRRNAA